MVGIVFGGFGRDKEFGSGFEMVTVGLPPLG